MGFGNQGDLFGNAMTWWDHDTGSIWSQPLGEAILGPLRGKKLEPMVGTLTTWVSWTEAHPDTLALDVHAWRTGFYLEEMSIVLDLGTEAIAFAIPALQRVGVVNEVVAGLEVAAVIDPQEPSRWAVFSRRLDDSVAELALTSDGLVDTVSGTVFDTFLGRGLSGPLSDQNLDKLAAFTSFPEDYLTFFPDGSTWPR